MIGDQIRQKRLELNYSLRKLGELTGLSSSFLSLVEKGTSNPSLDSLHKIARALEVSVFDLYGVSETESLVSNSENRPKIIFPKSNIEYELLTSDLSRQIMALLIRLEKGAWRECTPLARPTEQWIYVIEGNLRVMVTDNIFELKKGDGIQFNGDSLQKFQSIGEEETLFINVIVPPVL